MRILGIHDGHNAAVALLQDGKIVFALQEERPTNIKNYFGFPEKAIATLFSRQKIDSNDIDFVALTSHYVSAPMSAQAVKSHFNWQGTPLAIAAKKISKLRPIQILREKASLKRRLAILKHLGFPEEKIKIVEHHLCHAASSYFGLAENAAKKYLVLTLDGGGDWLCSTVNIAQNGKIERLAETAYGHSVGDLYARTTFMMGMTPWEHEYKLMGMAPYANYKYSKDVADIYAGYLDLDPLNPLVFKRKIFEDTNHILSRLECDLKRKRFDNIAGGIQLFIEELLKKWVVACIHKTGIHNILCGGGVFMNIKANKIIAELPEVTSISIFPSCGDESNPMGAAYELYHEISGSMPSPLEHLYLGPAFSQEEINTAITEHKPNSFFKVSKEPINKIIAQLLAQGKIVARATGAVEFGARALGNRTIFADPMNPKVISTINTLIKSRDFWMPFAPILLKENCAKYLKNPKSLTSPYMMMGFDITDLRDDMWAALHPADKSARAQILEPGQNDDVSEILTEFEKLTGRGVLLNTSFNLHGYPIVFGPKEALDTFKNSGLEYLAMGNYLLQKI